MYIQKDKRLSALSTHLWTLNFHGVLETEWTACCALCPCLLVQSFPPACSVPTLPSILRKLIGSIQKPDGGLIYAFLNYRQAWGLARFSSDVSEERKGREGRRWLAPTILGFFPLGPLLWWLCLWRRNRICDSSSLLFLLVLGAQGCTEAYSHSHTHIHFMFQ